MVRSRRKHNRYIAVQRRQPRQERARQRAHQESSHPSAQQGARNPLSQGQTHLLSNPKPFQPASMICSRARACRSMYSDLYSKGLSISKDFFSDYRPPIRYRGYTILIDSPIINSINLTAISNLPATSRYCLSAGSTLSSIIAISF